MQFRQSQAARTQARREGHAARILTRWAGHVPPVQTWREENTHGNGNGDNVFIVPGLSTRVLDTNQAESTIVDTGVSR